MAVDGMFRWSDNNTTGEAVNYVEAYPGDTVTMYLWINNLDGQNWYIWAYGALTCTYWDPAVIENGVTADWTGSWLRADWPNDGGGQGNGYWYHYWTGSGEYLTTDRLLVGYNYTIKEDAPLGETIIGLESGLINQFGQFWWQYRDWYERIDANNRPEEALTINVLSNVLGDFDGDGHINAVDIDLLSDAIEGGSSETKFDVNIDGFVDEDDLIHHIATLVERTDGGVGTYRGDFNLDGYVDGTDLAILKAGFGLSGLGYAAGNANADDFVNGTDLAIFKATFGFSGTPGGGNPPAVPGPATLSLLGLGAAALLRRRSR
jgi:MYXO-CTERM domain-containing protein